MTARRIAIASLLVATCAFCAVAAGRWRNAVPASIGERPAAPRLREAAAPAPGSIDSAASMLVDNDPFRFSNTPPIIRFESASNAVTPPTSSAPMPIRPRLALKAIVGGPPWSAVIDGIPGQPPAVVVRPGSRFDQLTVAAVTRDSVVVRGADTIWVLRFGGQP